MELIDTHTHLDFADFDTDRREVLAHSREVGVRRMVLLGCISRIGSACGIWYRLMKVCSPPLACTRCTSTITAPPT